MRVGHVFNIFIELMEDGRPFQLNKLSDNKLITDHEGGCIA